MNTETATSAAATLPPVEKRVRVRLGVAEAFDLFTREIARWWPLRTYACDPASATSVTLEAGVGRRVFETGADGTQRTWGTVTRWNPPHAFAMTWHPGQPEELATHVAVFFHPVAGGGCELHLVHDGWEARGAQAADVRNGYDNGWPAVLALFADAAGGLAAHGGE
jgi:hypothetical protein